MANFSFIFVALVLGSAALVAGLNSEKLEERLTVPNFGLDIINFFTNIGNGMIQGGGIGAVFGYLVIGIGYVLSLPVMLVVGDLNLMMLPFNLIFGQL